MSASNLALAWPCLADDPRPPMRWADAWRQLADARDYWLASVQPDGRPQLVPVLAVWTDGALHLCAGPAARRARNLARDPRCVISTRQDALDLVVEGVAQPVRDARALQRVVAACVVKYGWDVDVLAGSRASEGVSGAGDSPAAVWRVVPATAFAFPANGSNVATRWRFG